MGTLHLYYRCIRIYLQSGGNLTADIQVSSLLTLGESLVSILSNESALFPDSRKGEKFSWCLSFLLLVSLLCEFPDLVCSPCMDTDHIHKCKDLLHRLRHVSLCGRFLDVSKHLDTLML